MHLKVSVIVTVFNETNSIERLLASLASQTRRPDEVVICDGGSTDGTAQIIRDYAQNHPDHLPNLRLVVEPGANISRGRNVAIAAAHGPLIAATDAGVRLSPQWLEQLMAPWVDAPESNGPQAVAGFFLPDTDSVFTTAMAATVLPLLADIDPAKFLPSSRSVAFRKTAWAQIGGYPEWLDYCEDLIFDFKLGTFAWAPEALVYFRPRASLRSFCSQYYRYARGDGKADLWRKRHLIRYATYCIALPLLLAALWLGSPLLRGLGWLGLLAGLLYYCGRPWQRVLQIGSQLSLGQKLQAALWVPVIRAVGDVAKMIGYPVGLCWRWQNRARPELWWRE